MGERKGTNKYYPPDFDPAKHGSLNKYHGSHPLRERARKLAQGILIIRFEMPYNVWCDGCKSHIGMGVRYNAEKRKVGTYYTTPIYRFRMKCHLCVNHIELQTDPAGCDYVIVSGARRKEERWDPRDNGQLLPTGSEEKARLEADAMFRLEHGAADRAVLQRAAPTLQELQQLQRAWRDDFGLNSRLRQRFREEKRAQREEEEEAAALATKAGLSAVLGEEEEDRRLAALLALHCPDSFEARQRMKRSEISARPWFSPGSGGDARRRGGPIAPPTPPAPPPATPPTPARLGIVRRHRAGGGGQGDPPGPKLDPSPDGDPPGPPRAPPSPTGGPSDPKLGPPSPKAEPSCPRGDPPGPQEDPRRDPSPGGPPPGPILDPPAPKEDPSPNSAPPSPKPALPPPASLVADYSDTDSDSA